MHIGQPLGHYLLIAKQPSVRFLIGREQEMGVGGNYAGFVLGAGMSLAP